MVTSAYRRYAGYALWIGCLVSLPWLGERIQRHSETVFRLTQ